MNEHRLLEAGTNSPHRKARLLTVRRLNPLPEDAVPLKCDQTATPVPSSARLQPDLRLIN